MAVAPSVDGATAPPRPRDAVGVADEEEEEEIPTEFTSVRVMWHAPSDYIVVSGGGDGKSKSTTRQCCYVRDTASFSTTEASSPSSSNRSAFTTIIMAVLMDRMNDTVAMLYDRVAEVLLQDRDGVGRCEGDLKSIRPAIASMNRADSSALQMLPPHNRFILGLVAEPSLALTADGEEADGFGGGAASTTRADGGANASMNATAATEKRRALYGCVSELWAARGVGSSPSASSPPCASLSGLSIRPLRPLGVTVGNALGEFEFPIIAAAHHDDDQQLEECQQRFEGAYFTSSALFRGIEFDAPLSSVMRKGDTVSLMLL